MAGLPLLLSGRSAMPGSADVLLALGDAPSTGYRLMQPNLGNVDWQKFYSGARGSQGARLVGAEPQNRAVSLQLEVVGTSQDDLHRRLERLWDLDSEWRRFGGSLTWRPRGGSFKLYFDVLDSSARLGDYDRNLHLANRARVELLPVCAPYLEGDPYDIFDGFETDTFADWTKDADGAGLVISGGLLLPTATGASRLRHTGRGYLYNDQQVQVEFRTGSSVTNFDLCVFFNGDTSGDETFLSARVQGGNLSVTRWLSGAPGALQTTAFTPSASTTYWLRATREDRRLRVEVFAVEPAALGTASVAAISYDILSTDAARFQAGHSGLRISGPGGEQYDDFSVQPFTYRDSILLPDERLLTGHVPGDAPPLADISVAASGASAAPLWGMFAWWPKPLPFNWCYNGDFESSVSGWSVAAVTGVTGAATSIAQSGTAARCKYGVANAQIVTPATANTGATFKINRRFLPGKTYTLLVWASSAAGTTLARCRLGVSGDIASCFNVALSPTPSLFSAKWTPTAARDGAYACFEVTAATLTTMNIDGVCVVEGGVPLFAGVNSSAQNWVMYDADQEFPPTPFLAIVNASAPEREIVRVESIGESYEDASGAMVQPITVTRALEGTTGQTQPAAAILTPLPPRGQMEGRGAQPVFGIVEGESADAGNLATWTPTADAGARLGLALRASGLSGIGAAWSDFLVDPHLSLPDDFTQGEVAVEVWGRFAVNAGLTAPKLQVGIAPETATVAAGALTSLYGGVRYTEEFGFAGRLLVKPSSGEAWRFVRLGILRFPVDRARPLRWRLWLRYAWTGATAATAGLDYLVLVPAGGRALSPTAKTDDTNFPRFFNTTLTAVKTIRSDLSGLVQKPGLPASPDHGLGGSLIELPTGEVSILGKLSSLVPDDPASNTTTEELAHTGYLHVAVTPRFTFGRGT